MDSLQYHYMETNMKQKALKQLDAQLAHWEATSKLHDARLRHREWLEKNDERFIADRKREDAMAEFILKHLNGL